MGQRPYPSSPKDWTMEEKERFYLENTRLLHKAIQPYKSIFEYDDLQQDAALAWWKAYDSYDPLRKVKLTTYIFRAIKNEINMKIRANTSNKRTAHIVPFDWVSDSDKGKELSGMDNLDLSQTDGLHPTQKSLDEQVADREIAEAAKRNINKILTEQEQVIFRLSLNGKTQKEIGMRMGQSQAKISNTLKMIRSKLIYELLEEGFNLEDFL